MADPSFRTGVSNPFGLTNVGSYADPALADIDGDGDLDAFIGNQPGNTLFYQNTGTANNPAFSAPTTNPFGLGDVGLYATPTFADIDGDGDLDAFIGNQAGETWFYQNTGSNSSAAFAAAVTNPFGLTGVGTTYANPTFADIDHDGKLDAFIGNRAGDTLFFQNTGTAGTAAFAAAVTNPFGLTKVNSYASPNLVDIDGDGDLDAFIKDVFYRNTGTAGSAAFSAPITGAFSLTGMGGYPNPAFADIDGDGDFDAFYGNNNGNTVFYFNQSAATITDLNGDSVAWAGIGNTVLLDSGSNATLSNNTLWWNGATLTVKRTTTVSVDVFSFNSSGFTVSGANLQTGGSTTFATFTNTGGTLTITFNASATTALVQDVMRGILYRNDTPYGDATIRFTLNDGSTATADVTVSSDTIYVTNTTDTATISVGGGVSFSEAVAIAAADTTGNQTLVLLGSAFATSLAGGVSIGENLTVNTDAVGSGTTFSSNTITIGSGFTLTFTNVTGKATVIASGLAGAGTLVKTGEGTLTLSGAKTYTGATTISAGILIVTNATSLGTTAGATTVSDGASLRFQGGITVAESVSVAGAGISDTGALLNNNSSNTLSGTVTLTGDAKLGAAASSTLTLSGVISGGFAITKVGAGTLTVSGNNTYTGATTVSAGILTAANANALGTTAGATTVSDGATLRFQGGITVAENVSVTGNGVSSIGALNSNGDNTLSGNVTLTGDARLTVTSGTLTLSGVISGGFAITKNGTGLAMIFSGNNTYTGATTISAGTLIAANNNALGTTAGATTVSSGAALGLQGGITVAENVSVEGIGVFIDGALVNISGTNTLSGTVTLTGDSRLGVTAGELTLSGAISGGFAITKVGTGLLTFSGNNTYTGTTTVSAGTLLVNGTHSGSGAVSVASGATLGGSGSLAGSVTASAGSTLTAGSTTTTEDLALTNGLTVAGTLSMQIGGTTAGSGYDQFVVTGTVDLTGATLSASLINSFTPAVGNSFTLINNDGSDAITGTVSVSSVALANNDTFKIGVYDFQINYQGGDGNDLVLTTIDITPPTVSSVTSGTTNGAYKTGDVIAVTVQFSEVVNVTGTPQLTLETGSTDRVVEYSSGTGTNTLTFNYTVQAGDTSADLDYTGTTALALNSGTIKDAAGNNATLTLAAPGAANSLGANKAIVIDTTAPSVAGVSSVTGNGSYNLGGLIELTVQFSEAVTVTGTPQLTLETGSTDRAVNYTSGSGTNTLTFNYTVQAGDISADLDYTGTTALALNGGTIKDAAGNAADLTLAAPGAANSLGNNRAFVVDGRGPVLTGSTPADNAIEVAVDSNIVLTFNENVSAGSGNIVISNGTDTRTIPVGDAQVSISGATVTINPTANLNINSSYYVQIASTALGNAAGNSYIGISDTTTLNFNTPDTIAPTVNSVTSTTANGNYKAGDVIAVTVQFSEVVNVISTPQLTLETGSTERVVNYTSGSGTNTLTFNYTVQAGDTSADLDYQSITALALNGGTIKDAAGNNATLTLALPGAANSLGANKAIIIDTTAPTAVAATVAFSADTGASSTDFITQTAAQNLSGTYTGTLGAGDTLQISLDNGATWTPATAAAGGTWTLTGQTLAASNTLKVRVVDTAGNSSAVLPKAYVLDNGAPVFAGATVNGNTLVMTYTSANALDAANIPAASAFTVMRGTTAITVTGVTVNGDGKTVTLTLASAVANGDAVTVAYADPSAGDDANAIQNSSGNDAAALTATAVTNNTPAAGGGSGNSDTNTGTDSTNTGTGGTSTGGTDSGGTGTGGTGSTGTGSTNSGTGGSNTGTNTGTTETATTTTVDGMTVTGTTKTATETITDPVTGTEKTVTTNVAVTTVPIVPDTRQEQDTSTALADIPLAKDNSGQTLLQASLPPGVGLTSEAVTGGNSQLTLRELLIAASEPRTEQNAFAGILGQGIDSYVPGVHDEAQVTVRTVTFQTPPGSSEQTAAADAPPIVITGASGTGEQNQAHPDRQEALVIDVRNLPHGTVLQLNNVEFAIIIGATRVTGGNGQNFAIGDNAVQYMVLGADDDLLHGGGGDDTVGSKGGNDQLYGDDGNDLVVGGLGDDTLEGGNGDDILQGGQSDAGAWTFSVGSDGTLKTQFTPADSNLADGSGWYTPSGLWFIANSATPITTDARVAFTTQPEAKLETVALLYHAVTGHLPDVYDMSHWATQNFSDGQYSQLADQAYRDKHPELSTQPVDAQVSALIRSLWGDQAATPERIAAGTDFIKQGGDWAAVFSYLALHPNAKSTLLNSQGELPLTQTYQSPELGWSSDTGNDQLFGGAGNDILVGGRGRNLLDGGAGSDRAVVVENSSDYVFRVNGSGQLQLSHKLRADSDILVGIESVVFGDKTLATGASNLDGATLKSLVGLYRLETGAAPSLAELNAQAAHTVKLVDVAAQLMQTPGYQSQWAGLSDSQFLAQLSTAVVGAPLAGAEQTYWLGQLANGLSRGQAFIEAVGVASYQSALFGGEGVVIGG